MPLFYFRAPEIESSCLDLFVIHMLVLVQRTTSDKPWLCAETIAKVCKAAVALWTTRCLLEEHSVFNFNFPFRNINTKFNKENFSTEFKSH